LNRDREAAERMVHTGERQIATMAAEVERIATGAVNPFVATMQRSQQDVAQTTAALKTAQDEKNTLDGQLAHYDFWRTNFRKLRLFMIRQVLAVLEVETANAASSLGLLDWQIRYSTEIETRSGSIKPGVHITVVEPGGATVVDESGGEEQRVRLAVALGMSSLIQTMAGVDVRLEVFDEPSAWLSQEGIDALLTTLRDRAISTGKSIWLLDHRVLSYGDFAEQWRVEKSETGSRVFMEAQKS
jgi:DNA repair exonuclease SbcCD ATPase subunit